VKHRIALLGLLAAPLLFAADPPAAPVKVARLEKPEKALKFEVVAPGKLEDVWAAFTTGPGLETWLWSDCTVDLRAGGEWTVHYPGNKTGGGSIVTFTPLRSVEMRAMAPEQFPTVRSERTRAIFEFEAVENGTRVTLTQTGWKQGKEWDDAYDYLAKGNAQLLAQLWYRFAKGPIDWHAAPAK
jgi:uncharacterized protein YndB with AHSA1/START domain